MKSSFLALALMWANSSALACSVLPDLKETLPQLSASIDVRNTLDQTWTLKMALREQMKKDYDAGNFTETCSRQYKTFFSELRIYEDRVADLGARKGMNTTDTPYTYRNPQMQVKTGEKMIDMRKDLQSGDLILSRGNAFTSSAIAHLGDTEQQFSHMSLVYRDPKTSLLYTIEAHIEIGVMARPLQANIDEMNSRDVIFRFQDQKLAHRAAQYMYYRALIQSATMGNINYDFAMNMKEDHSLFCSEIVSHAFDHVSKGMIQIPLFKSSLTERNVAFEKSIGIHQKDIFLPADIENDPRFTLIGEWKDWKMIRDLHEKDAILRAMLSWIEKKDYHFDQDANGQVWLRKNIIFPLRRIPLLNKLVEDRFPLNMSQNLLALFTLLDQVGETLQEKLSRYNDLFVKKSGVIPTQEWMMAVLEKIRQEDENAAHPDFHGQFHSE